MPVEPGVDGFRVVGGDPDPRVLLLSSDAPQHHYLYRLLAAETNLVGRVVEPDAAQVRRLWRRGAYRTWSWRRYHGVRQWLTGRAAVRRRYFAGLAAGLPVPATVPTTTVDWINDRHACRAVRTLRPDVVVVCGTSILRDEQITAAGLVVNVHGGWLPDYKGNHGVYFAYRARDWDRIGASVHVVTARLDGGDLLGTAVPGLFPTDTDEELYSRSVHAGALLLVELLHALRRGEAVVAQPQARRGTTYRHRDRTLARELVLWLARRTGRHPVPLRPGPLGLHDHAPFAPPAG